MSSGCRLIMLYKGLKEAVSKLAGSDIHKSRLEEIGTPWQFPLSLHLSV